MRFGIVWVNNLSRFAWWYAFEDYIGHTYNNIMLSIIEKILFIGIPIIPTSRVLTYIILVTMCQYSI